MSAFTWIGIGVVCLLALVGTAIVVSWVYLTLVHTRFSCSFFRRGKRRISLASWYNSWIMHEGEEDRCADDWPIGPRPFYLSYRYSGEKRVFIMFGTMVGHRHSPIRGVHPGDV